MKRVQERIKDLVDIRTYETIKNFANNAAATVAAYRFTDATSDLMAKWLDEIVEISHRGRGAARALAGNRGVGKSHFFAVLGALCQHTDLRTRVGDQHAAMSAQRLVRQRYQVCGVERGLGKTLGEELRQALDKTFGADGTVWGDNPARMLEIAAAKTDDLPLIVLVDSAYDRQSRIKRDDGATLGEMAEAARATRVFLAIALDDDIAGADGVNAAIARTCQIDYLDQEHLYRIVETFLYQKRPAARQILRELYQNFREAAPGFNWSEPRFVSLYPIHPVVVDVTPAVRLYAPRFAFLPFAAENAAKVLNRPAHSLLALDEVFDRIEPDLRKSAELTEIFEVYDELTTAAIAQIPIMQRLQAKLILKGLLLTSLDGRGATARELGAAMLIYDESSPASAVRKIEEIISLFAAAVAPEKLRSLAEAGEFRYSLGNSAAANFEAKLAEAAREIDVETINSTLLRGGTARFADWHFQNQDDAVTLEIQWRGSKRAGEIVRTSDKLQKAPENLDWQILIQTDGGELGAARFPQKIVWQIAALRPEEQEIVRRRAALASNAALGDEFGETARAAELTFAAVLERIWTRVFLDEAVLLFENKTFRFSSEAKSARALSDAIEIALAPIFDELFPAHPHFEQALTAAEVSVIVSDLFGAANPNAAETQTLAETFAAPLGLAAKSGAYFALESDENLLRLPLVQTILETMNQNVGRVVPLSEMVEKLRVAPYGLSREADNLLLAALVARRRLEFVTASGDRITHRSLDLKIIWADITGVAQSAIQPRTSEELANWARLLTGEENLISVEKNREEIVAALRKFADNWNESSVLARFEELPDIWLNVRAWRAAQRVARGFGATAEAIGEFLKNNLTLEDALERAIDAFGDAPEAVSENRREIQQLETFINAARQREAVWRYVARAETTTDAEIETLRGEILTELSIPANAFDAATTRDFENLWRDFRRAYTDFYVERHDAVMHSATRGNALENLIQTAEFVEFSGLTELPLAHENYKNKAARLKTAICAAQCSDDVREILQSQPFCACGFRLINAAEIEKLTTEFQEIVAQGRQHIRRTLTILAAPLAAALNEMAAAEANTYFAERARELAANLSKMSAELPVLSTLDLRLLNQAARQMPAAVVRVRLPKNSNALTREDLRSKLNQWLDNLPNAPVLVKMHEED
jgi:hypothetical protein